MLLQSIITIWSFKTLLSSAATLSGKATYYGGNEEGGACGYSHVPALTFPFGYFAAAGGTVFDDGYGCGKCFEIKCIGPYGDNPSCYCSSDTPTVTISVMDQCPECGDTHFDLNTAAMERIVAPGLAGTCGVIEIEYQQVNCDYAGDVVVRNKGGTSPWWYGLHLDDVAGYGGISKVELYQGNSLWGICAKQKDSPSFWFCARQQGDKYPTDGMDLKLTAGNGDTVTAVGCISSLDGGKEMECEGTNLPDIAGGGSSGGSNPTTQNAPEPTSRPTPRPTPSPETPGDNSGGSTGSGTITITNKNGLNEWWYAVVVTDSDGNYMNSDDLSFVKMKDGNMNSYESGTSEWDYWKFTANTPYSPNFSFKIKSKSTGEVIQTTEPIESLSYTEPIGEKEYTEITSGFSYTEDNDNDDNKLSWGAWFAIIFCILLIIACIIIGTFCYIKRQKQKGQVEFDEKYQVGDTPTGKVSSNNDSNKQTETQQEVEEIEVEMDMETR